MSGSTRNISGARGAFLARVVLWILLAVLVAAALGFATGYALGRALL